MTTTTNRRRGNRRGWLALGLLVATTMLVGASGGSGGTTSAQAPPSSGDEPFVDVARSVVDQARTAADVTRPGPDKSRDLLLNRPAMAALLASAPAEGAGALRITLPAPDGTPMAFDVWQTPIMAPELAAKYPEITTYGGQGVTDPAATIAFDLTPNGFHAQVLTPSGNWYIDPAVHLADRYHQSFYRDDYTQNPYTFVEPNADEIDQLAAERPDPPVASRAGATLRTHRLAMAANQDYTSANGGTRALALAEIVTSITRVSGIYEKEMAVRLQLVANTDQLVYESYSGSCWIGTAKSVTNISGPGNGSVDVTVTTSTAHGLSAGNIVILGGTPSFDSSWAVSSVLNATQFRLRGSRFYFASESGGAARQWSPVGKDCDPYNNNTLDIDVNQGVIDSIIGDANYDIGHVYTTGSGGVAGLGVVGISGQKARGTTGLPSPQGDAFYVDFVAHEMGHQYGGSHTFNGSNGSCSGNASFSQINRVEPGSGSTIQAYAGICGFDDLQQPGQGQAGDGGNASDPYFNSRSFDEMQAHIATVPGAGSSAPTGNIEPVVNAGADVYVPARTPFFLGATGSDGNGDTLTYTFEQRDGGTSSSGRALDNPEITAGPLFRSFPPTTNPTSFFPRLSDVRDGSTNQNGACPALDGSRNAADCWAQYLVPVGSSRDLNFRATARDNRANGGGVSTDDTIVHVHNTGDRFQVLSPNGGATNGNFTVTWNVAGTSGAPIGASTVSIRLSTDGGLTFPTELAHNTPNDGSQAVSTTTTSSTARIMVHSGNYVGGSGFFDISDGNVNLTGAPPTAPTAPRTPQGTPGNGQVTVTWTAPASDGNSPIIEYKATSAPGGKTCTTAPPSLSCTVTGLTNGQSYTFAVTARNAIGTSPAATTPAVVPRPPKFTKLAPSRLEDTRGSGKIGTKDGTGAAFQFNVFGRGGLPPAGIDALSLNVTVANGEQPFLGGGFVTVWDCGARPTASNLNFGEGQTIPNAVITPVSATGNVCIYVYGRADILVDVNGFFPTGSDFIALTPKRVKDTRPNKVGAKDGTGARLEVAIAGLSFGVPTGAKAVSLNVTAANGENPFNGGGFVTVWDCGNRPLASNLNFGEGQTIPNAVITPLSADGKICVYVYGLADILIDVNGYFPNGGGDFVARTPVRLEDTRPNKVGSLDGTAPATQFQITGRAGVPAPAGVEAVSLNITAANGENPFIGGGFVTVNGCTPGGTSNLNFGQGQTIPNAVITPVSPTGKICVYVYGRADILIDINGYFPS